VLQPDLPKGICPQCALREVLELGEEEDAEINRPESPAARRFGDYELLREIGRGGMGVVYVARQRNLNRIVAVKMLLAGRLADGSFIERFRAEASAGAGLQHPNIVAVHEVGVQDGQDYFSMDYVEGQNLAQAVGQHPLTPARAAGYVALIAKAIHHAHERGILHRDLKPSNVLVDANDQPRVTDFGLARRLDSESSLTLTGQVLGSPNFIPPEQAGATGSKVGRPSDVYALGGILYYLLTARAPFQGESLEATLHQVLHTEPVSPRLLNPEVPRDLETICLKCLHKAANQRYQTAYELAEELGRFLHGEPIHARPVGQAERLWRWARRKPAMASLIIALHLIAVAGLSGVLWEWRRAEKEKEAAQAEAITSTQIAKFLEDMLESVGPSAAKGRDTALMREVLENTVTRMSKDLTNQPKVEIKLRAVIAETYHELGLYQQMESLAQENLQLARSRLAHDRIYVAEALRQLGDATMHLGNLERSERLLREALREYEALPTTEVEHLARAHDDLANTLQNRGNYTEAEQERRNALAFLRKLWGNDHVQVAASLNNLATLAMARRRFQEAETMFRQTLATRRKLLGDEHLHVLQTTHNLAIAVAAQGRLEEAESLHREALAGQKKLVEGDHPLLALSLVKLGECLFTQSKLHEAETVLREAAAILRGLGGDKRANTVVALADLGLVLQAEGKVVEAQDICQEAYELWKAIPPPTNPAEAYAPNKLAEACFNLGDFIKAESLFLDALAIKQRLLGGEDITVASSLVWLSRTLAQQARLDEAEKALREALAIQHKVPGDNDPAMAETLGYLARTLEAKGELDRAENAYLESLAIFKKGPPDRVINIAIALNNMSSVLERLGKLAEAEAALEEACTLCRQPPLDRSSVAFASLDNLARLFERQGRMPEALSSYREAAERGDMNAANKVAWHLATSPDPTLRDGTNAIWFAKLAVAATSRQDSAVLDTLAAAYAEAGQFTAAVQAQQDALALARDEATKADLASRLKLYQENTPYRNR
jgi:serine/threonine-protein kinase